MSAPARSRLANPDLFERTPGLYYDQPRRDSALTPAGRIARRTLTVGIEIRMRDTPEGSEAFKHLRRLLAQLSERRLSEAVLERAMRRFCVSHTGILLEAASRQRFVGRSVVEEDMIEVLDRAFKTGRADQGLLEGETSPEEELPM